MPKGLSVHSLQMSLEAQYTKSIFSESNICKKLTPEIFAEFKKIKLMLNDDLSATQEYIREKTSEINFLFGDDFSDTILFVDTEKGKFDK